MGADERRLRVEQASRCGMPECLGHAWLAKVVNSALTSAIPRRQISVTGSWTFSSVLQAEFARFVAERKVNVDAIFTHPWRIYVAEEAYRNFDSQAAGKSVLLLYPTKKIILTEDSA
jgi:threonine dehydrogenase-like Zn-dependent dehydrogenase